MFTGLVETTGTLRRRVQRGPGYELWIDAPFSEYTEGESIAVSGACLTVTEFRPARQVGSAGGFAAYISKETAEKTTLGRLALGAAVNLERSLRLGDRLGGHLVSGHVDGLARLEARISVGEATCFRWAAPPELLPFIAEKGSVTLDGVSLTVNSLALAEGSRAGGFEVMLIPHTQKVTSLGQLSVGAQVNLEVDLLARYVARLLACGAGSVDGLDQAAHVFAPTPNPDNKGSLLALLERSGFTGSKAP